MGIIRRLGILALLLGSASTLLAEPQLLWTKQFGARTGESLSKVIHLAEGGYMMTGVADYAHVPNDWDENFCIMFADDSLNLQWTRSFYVGGYNDGSCGTIALAEEEHNVVTAIVYIYSELIETGIWKLRYTTSGDSLPAEKLLGLEGWSDIQYTANGGFAGLVEYSNVVHYLNLSAHGDTLLFVKLSPLIFGSNPQIELGNDGVVWVMDNSESLTITKINDQGEIIAWTELNDYYGADDFCETGDGGMLIVVSDGFIKLDSHLNRVWFTPFENHYGKATQTESGEFLAAVRTFGEIDIGLTALRLSEDGEILIQQEHTGIDPWVMQVEVTSENEFYCAGQISESGEFWTEDFWLAKLNFNGDLLDTALLGIHGSGAEIPHAFVMTANGDYLVAYSTGQLVTERGDMNVMKVSADGDSLANFHFGTQYYDHPFNIIATRDGGALMTGVTVEFTDPPYHFVAAPSLFIRLDQNLDTLWTLPYRSHVDCYFNSIVETSDGGFIAAGYSTEINDDVETNHAELLKIAPNGQLVDIMSRPNAYNQAIRAARAGEFAVVGRIEVPEQGKYINRLLVIDDDFNVLLEKVDSLEQWRGWPSDVFYDPQAGYFVAGVVDRFPFLYRFDLNGNLLNAPVYYGHPDRTFVGMFPYSDSYNLLVDNYGSIYIANENGSQVYFYDYRERNNWVEVTGSFTDIKFFPSTPPYQTVSFLGGTYLNDIIMTKAEMFPLGIDPENSGLPLTAKLNAPYPNPFNSSAKLSYSLPTESNVRLSIYDAQGRKVALLDEGRRSAGEHLFTINSDTWSAGVYFARLELDKEVLNTKLVVIK